MKFNSGYLKKIGPYPFIIGLLVLANTALGVFWIRGPVSFATYPEAAQVQGKDFDQLSVFFKDLADKKGAAYAFAVLIHSPMPYDVDQHLLGHEIGEKLYDQKGLEGIYDCTPDLQNACSHSIVTGYLYAHGADALKDISDVCEKAPGGKTAYNQCFHGLGHGVLAFNDYDLSKAISMCESLATEDGSRSEDINCTGGAIMELVGGGFHDRGAWTKAQVAYFKKNDPLYPCDGTLIPNRLKPICYTFLTPHLFSYLGVTIGRAKPAQYQKAATFCDKVSKTDEASRLACFGGFGKEFAILAIGRNIRDVNSAQDRQLANTSGWCALISDMAGRQSCIEVALGSYYWGGENPVEPSIRFCNLVDNVNDRDTCFGRLTGMVGHFNTDKKYLNSFCLKLPASYQATCKTKLLSQIRDVDRKNS